MYVLLPLLMYVLLPLLMLLLLLLMLVGNSNNYSTP
jgi:hypothetical protein